MGNEDFHSFAAEALNLEEAALTGILEQVFPIVGVEFKGNRRQLFNNPLDYSFSLGDLAVVRVEKGEDLGRVVQLLTGLPQTCEAPQYEVLRRATVKDLEALQQIRRSEVSAQNVCKEKILKHRLEMKLVDVEYQFDGRKLTFYFTADSRVDFRQLVKDLAAVFRTRIELRQIGARDETRRFGGYGICGKLLCCATFIKEFCPITTLMAKEQNLPFNPSRISGCCGRLKCCLKYEIDAYHEALEVLPPWDAKLETVKGSAIVEKVDVFSHCVHLLFSNGARERIEAQQLPALLRPGFKPEEAYGNTIKALSVPTNGILEDEGSACQPINGAARTPASNLQRKPSSGTELFRPKPGTGKFLREQKPPFKKKP